MVGHEDLLEFYLLAKSHQLLTSKAPKEYDVVDDQYLKHLQTTSIPSNFKDSQTAPDMAMLDENEPSKLVSILGNYNPPQTCDIPSKLTEHHKSLLNLYDPAQKLVLAKIQNVDALHRDEGEQSDSDN